MKAILLAVAVAVATCSGCITIHPLQAEEPTAQQHVVQLPADAEKWYVSVIGDADSGDLKRLAEAFDSHEQLAKLKSLTHFNVIDARAPVFAKRYASHTRQLPCVRIQDASGVVLFQLSGDKLKIDADTLNRKIHTTLCWRRDQQQDEFDVTPTPDGVDEQPTGDGGPPDEYLTEENVGLGLLALLLLGAGGAAGGVWTEYKKERDGVA